MILPYELTDFPGPEVNALRRLASRDDADSRSVINVMMELVGKIEELETVNVELENENHELREAGEADVVIVYRSRKGGRPEYGQQKVISLMLKWHRQKWSYHKIAKQLNEDEFPTATGKGTWRPQTVKNIIKRARKRRE
jgi:hypothetical protein